MKRGTFSLFRAESCQWLATVAIKCSWNRTRLRKVLRNLTSDVICFGPALDLLAQAKAYLGLWPALALTFWSFIWFVHGARRLAKLLQSHHFIVTKILFGGFLFLKVFPVEVDDTLGLDCSNNVAFIRTWSVTYLPMAWFIMLKVQFSLKRITS